MKELLMSHYSFQEKDGIWAYTVHSSILDLVGDFIDPTKEDRIYNCITFNYLASNSWYKVTMTERNKLESFHELPEELKAMIIIWGLDRLLR